MDSIKISLGRGIAKPTDIPQGIYDTIEDFGIPLEQLKSMNLSNNEIIKVYNHINLYRTTVRYLKLLKGRLDDYQ